jgi:iron complex transport system substrate-binding protein
MVKKLLAAPLAAAALLALSAGGAADTAATPKSFPAATPKPFPVVLTTPTGNVTIRKQPKRIVSLSPTATESLFAIGAGSRVVAVDDLSNFPARAPRTRLSGYTPNAEAIAGYRPDLVVVRTDSGLTAALRRLRIPVLVQPEAASLAQAYAQVTQLGRATGYRKRAAATVRSMKTRIARAFRSVPRGRSLSVYHELTTDYYSVTSRTFIGQIYRRFGLRNIADRAGGTSDYPQLSSEYIVAASPDLIFLADSKCCGQSYATISARPGWNTIRAVRGRSVVRLDDDVASRWGPRVPSLVETIAATVKRARST